MFARRLFTIGLLLVLYIPGYCWRIEGKYLIIEKGDNLSQVAHSLFGSGIKYELLWGTRMDSVRGSNPHRVYDGMRFRIDSLLAAYYAKDTTARVTIINSEYKKPEDNGIQWKDIIVALMSLGGAFGGVFLGAHISNKNSIKNDRRKTAFDLLKEFNSGELYAHRTKANEIIFLNSIPPKKFEFITQLDTEIYENARSVFLVMNFFKQLYLLIQEDKIDTDLVPTMFGQVFYYWWTYCYFKYFPTDTTNDWESMSKVRALHNWFETNVKVTADLKAQWARANTNSFNTNNPAKNDTRNQVVVNLQLDSITTALKEIIDKMVDDKLNSPSNTTALREAVGKLVDEKLKKPTNP